MAYPVIDQNKTVAWDYPAKGFLFDKNRQAFAKCDREKASWTNPDRDQYLRHLDWQPIENIKDSNL